MPRPEQPLRIWLGTGGSPQSVGRAAELGLPMFLGILGGTVEHWAQYGHAYRDVWDRAGHPAGTAAVAVAVHGFVADDGRAKTTYLDHERPCSGPAPPRSADPHHPRPAAPPATDPAG